MAAPEPGAWTNWVNIANNENAGTDLVILPPPSEIVENGIKKVTQYRKDVDEDTGEVNYYKVVNCFQLLQVNRRISKNAITRKHLVKFGACEGVGPGMEKGITTGCPDYIPIEWEHEKVGEEEEEDNTVLNKLLQKSAAHSLLEEIAPKHVIEGESNKNKKAAVKEPMGFGFGRGNRGRYSDVHQMEETPTIRLLDIPRSTSFEDLRALVNGFHSKRIKLPRDQSDQDQNRGFAFVTFATHQDAKRAKETLHGHAYGTNILHCEWSRNYLNYLNANPEIKAALEKGESMYSIGRTSSGPGSRRPKFINSKRPANEK